MVSGLAAGGVARIEENQMTNDEFRRYGHQVVDWMADYLENIRDYPVLPAMEPAIWWIGCRLRLRTRRVHGYDSRRLRAIHSAGANALEPSTLPRVFRHLPGRLRAFWRDVDRGAQCQWNAVEKLPRAYGNWSR